VEPVFQTRRPKRHPAQFVGRSTRYELPIFSRLQSLMPNQEEFRAELLAQIDRAIKQDRPHIEVNAGELHRAVGGYPPRGGSSHSMPVCCNVLRKEMQRGKAEIVFETPSGSAPALTVRYYLPRP
jgi:hypothetical protein